jgi:D-glycero-beta-D-manno-heptose-7-phosphate kinase
MREKVSAPDADGMRTSARDRARLLRTVERFAGLSVVVLGDLVADEFIHGEIARVSREAPVLILKQREKEVVPGGGANAANNLADLGLSVTLLGAMGEDETGELLLRRCRDKGMNLDGVLRLREYGTPTKSRVLGALGHGRPQQIVRVDREPAAALAPLVRRRLALAAGEELQRAAGLLVSDYGYGAASPREVEQLCAARAKNSAPITLDSRYGVRRFSGPTAATPNEPEMEQAFGVKVGKNLDVLHRLARRMLTRQRFKALLVTRGREGMVLYEPGRAPQVLGIHGSDQVADVTGAGDTVIAVFTAALAAGADFLDAARLANYAGGVVVMKSGTATVSARELAETVRNA